MRTLASIKRISEVKDIPGKDRIGLAIIDGWSVIVQKADMKAGDPVVFCEIDSVLPDKPEFEFLKNGKGLRIKTLKMAGCISQGICFPLDILPPGEYAEGADVTEILGITKWEPKDVEDVSQETKEPKKKYPKFLMRFKWFRSLIKKKDSSGSKAFPNFISKSDETRVQSIPYILDADKEWTITEKIDGCLIGETSIKTDSGDINIAKIVNEKLPVRVLSYNEETGICEYKKITDYHKIPATRDRYRVSVGHKGKGNRPKIIECTDNHLFLTQRGWVRADELKADDCLEHYVNQYSGEMFGVLAGCILGDSSFNSNSENGMYRTVDFSHGEKQYGYFDYKKKLFGSLFIEQGERISGYGSKIKYGCLRSSLQVFNYLNLYFPKTGKKYVTKEFVNTLTPASLAFWYMDDGSISNRESESVNCRVHLFTNRYTREEVEILQEALERKFNIHADIMDKDSYKGIVLALGVKDTDVFFSLIAPYVCESMKYKLPKKYESVKCAYEDYTFDSFDGISEAKVLSIEKVDTEREKILNVYDLEVEDNHNYFAKNILVHNCSGTYAMVKHKPKTIFGKEKYEYIVCSRNVRLNKKDNSSYWRVSDKYNIEDVLKRLMHMFDVDWVAIQGECIAPNVQSNKYKVTEPDLYVFNLISPNGRMDSVSGKKFIEMFGMKWVPIIEEQTKLPKTVDEMLALAHGDSALGNTIREGLVCRSLDGKQSFKAVDPLFLMKYDA